MARPGKVWWNRGKGAWYSTIGGRQTRVADGDKTKEQAEEAWHQMHAKDTATVLKDRNPLRLVFEMHLDWRAEHHPASYDTHRHFLQVFLDYRNLDGIASADLRVCDLRAEDVVRWLYIHRDRWNDSTQFLAVSAVQSALNWAAKPERGIISVNPIAGLAKPKMRSRGEDALIEPADQAKLYAAAAPDLRQILFALRQTGTRPGNLRRVTAEEVNLERGCIVLRQHKTAGKTGKPTLIPVTSALKPLLQELCAKHRSGPIFRTMRGKPWTRHNLDERFAKLRKLLNLSPKTILYGYRHTTATDLLLRGVPDAKVAAMLGHADTKMLYRHYGHLSAHIATLAAEMGGAINGSAEMELPPPQAGALPAGGEGVR